ncbi:MAG: hypothetical protein IPJ06_05835 [Saprospiraceae bacterium]|nr:hypothetical protein [Saprospiraceae bacterium]
MEILVRNSDDLPDRCSRVCVTIDQRRKRRTGWFGQPEIINLNSNNKIKIESSGGSTQSIKIQNPVHISRLTFYESPDNNQNSQPRTSIICRKTLSGTLYRESDDMPAVGVKVCGYNDSTLCSSDRTNLVGEYSIYFLVISRGPFRAIYILDATQDCPNSYQNSGNNIDLDEIEVSETNAQLDVVIDDLDLIFVRPNLDIIEMNHSLFR